MDQVTMSLYLLLSGHEATPFEAQIGRSGQQN